MGRGPCQDLQNKSVYPILESWNLGILESWNLGILERSGWAGPLVRGTVRGILKGGHPPGSTGGTYRQEVSGVGGWAGPPVATGKPGVASGVGLCPGGRIDIYLEGVCPHAAGLCEGNQGIKPPGPSRHCSLVLAAIAESQSSRRSHQTSGYQDRYEPPSEFPQGVPGRAGTSQNHRENKPKP